MYTFAILNKFIFEIITYWIVIVYFFDPFKFYVWDSNGRTTDFTGSDTLCSDPMQALDGFYQFDSSIRLSES